MGQPGAHDAGLLGGWADAVIDRRKLLPLCLVCQPADPANAAYLCLQVCCQVSHAAH